jgi:hypothetical protein
MGLIITLPPFGNFQSIISEPIIEAVRVNTTLPTDLSLEDRVLNAKNQAGGKPTWIDLKCRQLRIEKYWVHFLNDKEYNCMKLNHKIKVNIPTDAYFDNGNYSGKIIELKNQDTIVIESSVEQRKGVPLPARGEVGIRPGMSVTILDKSLEVDGYLTERDKKYIEIANIYGIHTFMPSFVQKESDITDILALDPKARLLVKIEDEPGLDFVRKIYRKYRKRINLIAARGDGYVQVSKPDKIIDFCEIIIHADENAVFASRMLQSVSNPKKAPECSDIFDAYSGKLMGYKRFMLGDDLCTNKTSMSSAVGLFEVINSKTYKRK